MAKMLWELRLRLPRLVDDVVIETDTDDEGEARKVADVYIASLASPAVRFVRLRRLIVARSADLTPKRVADEDERKPEPATKARLGA